MQNRSWLKPPEPTWCAGCSNYQVSAALRKAITQLGLPPQEVVVSYDIGCAGNMAGQLAVCEVVSLHGRSIPFAVGVKMANPNLTVIAQGGDGGVLNEGLNHLIQAARRNDPITVMINNNLVFGLTTGQASAATPKGVKTRSTPEGNPYQPLAPLDLAAVAGARFVARAWALDIDQTSEILSRALRYPGFALVEIVQPCLIWAKEPLEKELAAKRRYLSKPFVSPAAVVGQDRWLGVLYRA